MSVALYSAGLGDVIRTIYQTASYKCISDTRIPMPVIVASHNPFAMEIFRFHRNAGNFILHDLGHKYEEFMAAGLKGPAITQALCKFAGVDSRLLVKGKSGGHVPVFDAPDEVDSTGHIVFQPFAGSLAARTFDEELTSRVAGVLQKADCPVFLVTRSYIRRNSKGSVVHSIEDARRFAGGNIKVLEHLSVPASLNLIKSCRAYVGSWSSLHQAAWFEDKPVAVFYPANYKDVVNRTGYAFGIDRENCYHSDFAGADMQALAAWLRRWSVKS